MRPLIRRAAQYLALFLIVSPAAAQRGGRGADTTGGRGAGLPLTPAKALKFTTDEGTWLSLDVSPDGRTIAVGEADKLVTLWDIAAKRKLTSLRGHTGWVAHVRFSPDGKTILSGGGSEFSGALPAQVRLWNTDSGNVERSGASLHSVGSVAFSPDGKSIATSSYDKLIKLWDVATGNEIRTLKDHIDAVYALAFTPDGKRLVSGAAAKRLAEHDDGEPRLMREEHLADGEERRVPGLERGRQIEIDEHHVGP